MTFHLDVDQNQFLPEAGDEVHAIVSVTNDAPSGGGGGEAVEIILLDCSGSMGTPPTKLEAARRAVGAALDSIRDGVMFAIVRGSHAAELIYPPPGSFPDNLAPAGPPTRQEAKASVAYLEASGGTAIGQWLLQARDLFERRPDAIHHAILLTDGKNESEEDADFEAAVELCRGRFQCDCRGVGTGFVVAELRKVSTALLGTLEMVAEPADLEADFRAMTDAAMGLAVNDVALRVWIPQGAQLVFFKQVWPDQVDLTSHGAPVQPLTTEFGAGAWGSGTRDYHLCVRVPRRPVGDPAMRAALVTLTIDGDPVCKANVLAEWTDDLARSTRINRRVALYTGQEELAEVVQEGLDALRAGDDATATTRLARAVVLAEETGNSAMSDRLGRITEGDPERGTFRLRPHIQDADAMKLDTQSTKTVRVKKPE
jgi:hypothetical protein